MTTKVDLGRIWHSADNAAEAAAWQEKYLKAGAVSVHLEPESDRPIVDMHIVLDRARAQEILGYEPGEEEWESVLSEDANTVVSHVQGMAETFHLRYDIDGIRDTVEQSCRLLNIDLTEAEITDVCGEVLAQQPVEAMSEVDRG